MKPVQLSVVAPIVTNRRSKATTFADSLATEANSTVVPFHDHSLISVMVAAEYNAMWFLSTSPHSEQRSEAE